MQKNLQVCVDHIPSCICFVHFLYKGMYARRAWSLCISSIITIIKVAQVNLSTCMALILDIKQLLSDWEAIQEPYTTRIALLEDSYMYFAQTSQSFFALLL